MAIPVEPLTAPEVPADLKSSNELVKRIRKLRWIGMEKEAEQLQASLSRLSPSNRDSVLTTPIDTD